jgi:hypothetical protein
MTSGDPDQASWIDANRIRIEIRMTTEDEEWFGA